MSFQGVEFTPEMRKMAVNVKHYFDNLKSTPDSLRNLATRLAASAVETGVVPHVRQFIRRANRNGDQVNVEIIRHYMRDELHCDVAHTTLWRALQRWGFEFGTGVRSAQLKESERIVILRRQYLRQKLANRDGKGQVIRPEVYLDESYINKNHSNDKTWYFEEAFPKKNHSIKRLREWLSNNEIPWTKDMLKSELFDLCSRFAVKPEFLIDRIARKGNQQNMPEVN